MAFEHLTQEVANRLATKMLDKIFNLTKEYHPYGFYIDFNDIPELDDAQQIEEMKYVLMRAYYQKVMGEDVVLEVKEYDNWCDTTDDIKEIEFKQKKKLFSYLVKYDVCGDRFDFSYNEKGPLKVGESNDTEMIKIEI